MAAIVTWPAAPIRRRIRATSCTCCPRTSWRAPCSPSVTSPRRRCASGPPPPVCARPTSQTVRTCASSPTPGDARSSWAIASRSDPGRVVDLDGRARRFGRGRRDGHRRAAAGRRSAGRRAQAVRGRRRRAAAGGHGGHRRRPVRRAGARRHVDVGGRRAGAATCWCSAARTAPHVRPRSTALDVVWDEPQRRVAPGQTLVAYDLRNERVLGGGIVAAARRP